MTLRSWRILISINYTEVQSDHKDYLLYDAFLHKVLFLCPRASKSCSSLKQNISLDQHMLLTKHCVLLTLFLFLSMLCHSKQDPFVFPLINIIYVPYY